MKIILDTNNEEDKAIISQIRGLLGFAAWVEAANAMDEGGNSDSAKPPQKASMERKESLGTGTGTGASPAHTSSVQAGAPEHTIPAVSAVDMTALFTAFQKLGSDTSSGDAREVFLKFLEDNALPSATAVKNVPPDLHQSLLRALNARA
ncbi:hypothetical protein UFOVP1299_13 [uncultured Caudovirales phage]|uniref:Uncharacterized protein n=1 Tax=uncultured Caudovirales phage TaxID=2100421 RepID=A0A6J5RSW5_9CAUD|nr:hypothetical protein UFOVP1299_13 [uncultured Caudovirales phage]